MKKVFIMVLLVQFFTSSCKADNFDLYKDEIHELTRDPKNRIFKDKEKEVDDLGGCQIKYELGQWRADIRQNNFWKNTWERDTSSINQNGIVSEGSIYLDATGKLNSVKILTQSNLHPVYIGPWYHSQKLQKSIRFFAYQKKEGGPISYQYESQTEENKNIPARPFSLSGHIAPDKFSLCVVKWTAKYGYNAVIDLHKNPWFPIFSKKYLVGTGKIIEAKE